ncbi:Diadenosine tetraphosphate (Ap4A) hydrolase [Desulfuromonas thiophila]|uniref:Diadenosine tetraphosphate (Ap4A) hydrolase n=2 Tax=Desulfuromonas thiophila TaxID=57664 RepID=A0A1G7EMX7_9BACT|nr:Diadenosine tetraphosphate (Ap4A) hydrolase [Desulfuromonas thiophila]
MVNSSIPSASACPFCQPAAELLLCERPLALALADRYPLTPGHCLIVPRRHIASLFDATAAEREALFALLSRCRERLRRQGVVDFNIGINEGAAAGQTIAHLHLHLIPRRSGDVAEPRGGVRWIFPDRAAYWEQS